MQSRVEKYNYNEKSKWRSGLYSTGLVVTSVFLLAGVNQLHNQGVSAQTTDTTQPSADNTSATVWMPDATLREKFAEAAGVSADTMTKADVAKVKSLKITDGVITSLEGLQYATGLESLTVIGSGRQSNGEQDYINDSQDSSAPYQYSSDSGTTDISSILKSNDYSYLGQLPNLKFLQLTGLGISTATVMKSIGENDTNLQYAYVDSNKISDLSVFNNINMPNLKVLNLANNQISDISVIKTITLPALTTLDVSYNNIQDIGSISQASWPSLTSLYASYNQISDINSITRAGFPNIQKLVADNNQIQNVDAFKDSTFTKLKYLSVNNNQISNINIMTDLYSRYPDLQTFKISGNKIYDISFMNGYSLQSNTDANNQTYSQTVSRVKTTGNQSQNNTFDLPIKTSDFEGKNDGSGLYYGSADPTGSTLHISNISSNVASVVYYDGTTALAADVNSGKDNNTGIKSFVVSNTNGNTPITYQWSGAQGQFNGSGTVNVNLVDAVEPTITANDQNLTVGDHFDPKNGVTADDQQNDGSAKTDLTTKLVVKSNNVDTSKPGTYQVVYSVTNSYGLTATKTIKVVVTAASAQMPSSNSSTSSNGGTTPSSNNSASSNGGTTPSSDNSTSSNGGTTPSSNSSTSSNGGTTPSSNSSTSSNGGATSSTDNSTSSNGGTTPSSNSSTSSNGGTTPSSNNSASSNGGTTSSTDNSASSNSGTTPSSNSSTSSNGGTTSSSDNSASSNGGTTPSSNNSASSNGGTTSSSDNSSSSNGGTTPSSNSSTSSNGGTTPSSNSSSSSNGGTTPSSDNSTSSNGGTTPSSNSSSSSNGGTTSSSDNSASSNGGTTPSSNSSTSSNGGTTSSSNSSTSGNGGTTPSSNSSTSTTTTAGQASSSESNFVGNVDTNSASIGAPDFRVNRYDNRQGGLLPMTSKLVQSYTVVYAVLAGIAASVMAIFVKMLRSHRN